MISYSLFKYMVLYGFIQSVVGCVAFFVAHTNLSIPQVTNLPSNDTSPLYMSSSSSSSLAPLFGRNCVLEIKHLMWAYTSLTWHSSSSPCSNLSACCQQWCLVMSEHSSCCL